MKKSTFISLFFIFLILNASCKKKSGEYANSAKVYNASGVVKEIGGVCTFRIKIYKGYDTILSQLSKLEMDSSIMTTREDTVYFRFGLLGGLEMGDSINFDYRYDYDNLGICAATGMDFYPQNFFVVRFNKIK